MSAVQYQKGDLANLPVGQRVHLSNGVPAVVAQTKSGAKRLQFVKAQSAQEAEAQVNAALAAGEAKRARSSTPLAPAAAQEAFDAYYKTTRHFSKGPRKGQRVYKSSRGRKMARTYDLGHTKKGAVISDMRYAGRHGPRLYDYQGVDTGKKVRKVSAAQLANQERFADAARKRARTSRAGKLPKPSEAQLSEALGEGVPQLGGYWW